MQEFELKKQEYDYRTKESFKTLRTNIEFSGEDIKVVGITSAAPNEGKSSISFELARSFAQAGKKTLLIDVDLRKSVMRNRYKRGNVRYGMTNALVGKKSFDDVICMTDEPNFYMAFAGLVPPNPSELLGSNNFKKIVEQARRDFDMVIIDTPPIGAVIDAAIVSKLCDGMVIVMKQGAISYRFARKIKEQLDAANAKIIGCVLNMVEMSGKGYYGKHYGRYYGKYYGKYYGNYYGQEDDKQEK